MITASTRTIRLICRRHAHRAEQPELPDPLVDRQPEGLQDAEAGDDDRQEQQDEHERKQLVHRIEEPLFRGILVVGLHVRVVLLQHRVELRLRVSHRDTVRHLEKHVEIERLFDVGVVRVEEIT